jgi:hypothetical protein
MRGWPHPPRLADENRPARIVGVVLIALGLLMALGAWGAYRHDTGIVASGVVAEGTVVAKRYRPDNPNEYYWIDYRFPLPDGRTLERSWSVGRKRWDVLKPGDRIPIRYQADDPSRNFPDGSGNTSLGLVIFASCFGATFAAAGLLFLRGSRRRAAPAAPDG